MNLNKSLCISMENPEEIKEKLEAGRTKLIIQKTQMGRIVTHKNMGDMK